MTFPRTKIQPPQPRPGTLLARPALEQRLAAALLSQRLVLVCAAAGFGKTSALARQVAQLPAGTALAWVACDEGDAPAQLFECLVAALEPFDLPWRSAPEALLRAAAEAATPAARRAVAAQVINALDACEVAHGVIVIDDLHRVHDRAVFEFIDDLLERFTPRWTLAIATRSEPPLALARLRAQGEAAEFRMDDLRFSAAEAQALGAAAGLPAAAVQQLHQRAAGWPVGLRLALNALRGAAPGAPLALAATAIDRHAIEFLTSEVIARLDAPLRDFLLACSVLPELTPARCAALTGDAQAGARLDAIERAGLFVSVLDGVETTLRLHDLFRDALQARLAREQPGRLQTLLQRAAASEPDVLRRVAWLQRAGDWAQAEQVLAAQTEVLVTSGQGVALPALLERFPPEQVQRSAGLQMVRAYLGWMRWDWAATIDATGRAAAAARAAGDDAAALAMQSYHVVALAGASRHDARPAIDALLAQPALQGAALCRTLLAWCWMAMRGGDQQHLAAQWSRMLDALQALPALQTVPTAAPHLARWYECSPVPPMVGLPGMRAPLQRFIDAALQRVPDHPTPLRGMCHVVQAWLHLWAGDSARAEASAALAAADSRWLARPVNVDSYTRSLQAVLLALRGRGAASLALINSLLDDVQAGADAVRARVYLSLYLFIAMRCAALLDDHAALAGFASRLQQHDDGGEGWLSPQQQAGAAALLAAARGDLVEACAGWRALLVNEASADIHGQMAEARLRLADALWQRGRPAAEAAALLQPLFERLDASADGRDWGAVLMAGPTVLARLAARAWGTALPQQRCAQLAQWAHAAASLRQTAAGAGHPPTAAVRANATDAVHAIHAADAVDAVDATNAANTADAADASGAQRASQLLTGREAEVLARIAAGDSNKLIARAFDLSPHTVKRHVANILDKLGLGSRGQAAAWWRANG